MLSKFGIFIQYLHLSSNPGVVVYVRTWNVSWQNGMFNAFFLTSSYLKVNIQQAIALICVNIIIKIKHVCNLRIYCAKDVDFFSDTVKFYFLWRISIPRWRHIRLRDTTLTLVKANNWKGVLYTLSVINWL